MSWETWTCCLWAPAKLWRSGIWAARPPLVPLMGQSHTSKPSTSLLMAALVADPSRPLSGEFDCSHGNAFPPDQSSIILHFYYCCRLLKVYQDSVQLARRADSREWKEKTTSRQAGLKGRKSPEPVENFCLPKCRPEKRNSCLELLF